MFGDVFINASTILVAKPVTHTRCQKSVDPSLGDSHTFGAECWGYGNEHRHLFI